jgi:hypothetical protein
MFDAGSEKAAMRLQLTCAALTGILSSSILATGPKSLEANREQCAAEAVAIADAVLKRLLEPTEEDLKRRVDQLAYAERLSKRLEKEEGDL